MWVCEVCGQLNDEQSNVCEHCGALRGEPSQEDTDDEYLDEEEGLL